MTHKRHSLNGGMRFLKAMAAALVVLAICPLAVCGGASAGIQRVPVSAYPAFEDDRAGEGLIEAVSSSIAYYEKLPAGRTFALGPDSYTARELISGLKRFIRFVSRNPSSATIAAFLKENGILYAFTKADEPVPVLFTGYYEPELEGRLKKTETFCHPLYPRPDDLVRVELDQFEGAVCSEKELIGRYAGDRIVPYPDRRSIETTDALRAHAPPIAWVADPIALFFLHVQGSGSIVLEDGKRLGVHFDITNGRPYRSIGKYLIDNGKISREEMSMQAIRNYIRAHPDEMEDIFCHNPRYVFFRVVEGGTKGSLGVDLTPGRSVALDQRISPAGALLFVSARKPVCDRSGKIVRWTPFSRFMCNQDTGSAIKGEGRADIFWGSGDYAETAAGYMKHEGKLYFLIIKPEQHGAEAF